jgi:ABC-2 type transport system permease protein
LLSPYDTLGKVESWVFGLDTTPASVVPAIALLLLITLACLWVIRNRIVSRLSI